MFVDETVVVAPLTVKLPAIVMLPVAETSSLSWITPVPFDCNTRFSLVTSFLTLLPVIVTFAALAPSGSSTPVAESSA